jgi:ketosteroid isomerase-like protein
MSDVWSHSDTVTALHPLGGEQVGWNDVRESFEQVGGLASGGRVDLVDQRIDVGEDLAYEVGVERGQASLAGEKITIDQRVTNVYRREGGQWKMVHHHSDLSPAMVALAQRLRAAA